MIISDRTAIRVLKEFIGMLAGLKDAVHHLKKEIKTQGEEIMQALEDLKTEVGKIKADIGGAVTKINDLAAQVAVLTAETVTEADLQAIRDDLAGAAAPLEAILTPPTT